MRIDVHGHVSAPEGLYAYKANLLAHRGAHGRGGTHLSDDDLRAALHAPNRAFGNVSHLEHLDAAGIDLQLISARPFQLMHSESPAKIVEWFTAEVNDVIHRICGLYPDRFRGVAALPQSPETEPARWAQELHRCVGELGFVGGMLNPDPHEGTGHPPGLGERYWYPVWEALCELDVPVLIHSAGCRPPARETYSVHFIQEETLAVTGLLTSSVFADFPELKVIVSHGGGAVPYQAGRFKPGALRRGARFEEQLRLLHFDTVLYTPEAIELLLRTVGPDRVLFGTERPGVGSMQDPVTGRWFDDIHLLIEEVDWLGDEERRQVFSGNAEKLFALELSRV
jgi:predicted TIM-barrel fold metal-dependent hydrolase